MINDNLNPVWEDEKCLIPVHPDGTGGEMIITVWDSDGPLTKGDFLGQVKLTSEEILFPPEEVMVYDLHPKVRANIGIWFVFVWRYRTAVLTSRLARTVTVALALALLTSRPHSHRRLRTTQPRTTQPHQPRWV